MKVCIILELNNWDSMKTILLTLNLNTEIKLDVGLTIVTRKLYLKKQHG